MSSALGILLVVDHLDLEADGRLAVGVGAEETVSQVWRSVLSLNMVSLPGNVVSGNAIKMHLDGRERHSVGQGDAQISHGIAVQVDGLQDASAQGVNIRAGRGSW